MSDTEISSKPPAKGKAKISHSKETMAVPIIPTGISAPKPLRTDGNMATNWKKFRRGWENYAIVSRLDQCDERFKTALFLSVIGEEAMEMFEGMHFAAGEDKDDLDTVIKKFEETLIGETNETYERFKFNSRDQRDGETIEQYLTALRILAQSCNFCKCLQETLLRDRVVLGIKDTAVRKRLLQERNLTLSKALDICRSNETTTEQLKCMTRIVEKSLEDEINAMNQQGRSQRSRKREAYNPREKKRCKYCGELHEFDKNLCPAYGKTCNSCGLRNHFSKVCQKKNRDGARIKKIKKIDGDESSDSGELLCTVSVFPEFSKDQVLAVQTDKEFKSKIVAVMNIKGGKEASFQVDTGATCNVIKLRDLAGTKYVSKLKKTKQVLKMYNSTTLKPVGQCLVQLSNPETLKKYKVNFNVIDGDHCTNLLGSKTVQQMGIVDVNYNLIKITPESTKRAACTNTVQGESNRVDLTVKSITDDYCDVFEGLGQLGPELHLEVDESIKPVQLPVRKVPESLKEPLKRHLAELEERGVIEKVQQPTAWVNSIVLAKKSNGNIRLCLDPRPLNKALKRCHHPMQTIEDVLPELGNAKVFTKVDCLDGYWQVPLDEESSLLTSFGTPFGRYKWKRLPFGISPAGEIFQNRLDQVIEDLEGIKTVADDILVIGCGRSMDEAVKDHDKKLKQLLDRCRERKVKLDKDKVLLKQTSVPYIGHLLTLAGVKPDPSKIEAIRKMSKPSDVAGVRRIMGAINYLAKFLPQLSEVMEPLRQLTKKDVVFVWDEVHDQAFSKLKELVTQPPVLKYYEPEKELVLQCDASEKGLGAALLQEGRPLAYASRALSPTESNYAQIEKELLAIVFAAEKFHQYTFGRPVRVESDHQPLESIFKKPLATAPRRLQKMLMRLQMYDLHVVYKKGSELYLADTLSRNFLHIEKKSQIEKNETDSEIEIAIGEMNQLLANEDTINDYRQAINEDETLQVLKKMIQSGWPETKDSLPEAIAPYFHFRDELVIESGLILRGDRLVIPKSLRKSLLESLHASHQGIQSTLRRARETMYWPNMNSEIKDYVSKCDLCCSIGPKQSKETLICHNVPERPWAKIATDLFQFENKDYLITVDYFSNFFEIDRLSSTSARTVIGKMKTHISRYGIPDEIVSDQGSQFISQEFQEFISSYGIKHVMSSPHYHQSNGKAEAAVKQAKRTLRVAKMTGRDPYLILLDLRNTPQEGFNTSPAQRLMSRRTKTLLPTSENLLKPTTVQNTRFRRDKREERQKRFYNKGARNLPTLEKGDQVWLQPVRLGDKQWKRATVLNEVGVRSYEVETEDERILIRNRRHLKEARQRTSDNQGSNEVEFHDVQETTPDVNIETSSAAETDEGHMRTRSGRIVRTPKSLGDYHCG